MRFPPLLWFGLGLLGACTQIIGLDDYEVLPDSEGGDGGNARAGGGQGGVSASGGTRGGTGGRAGEGGSRSGAGGTPGAGGASGGAGSSGAGSGGDAGAGAASGAGAGGAPPCTDESLLVDGNFDQRSSLWEDFSDDGTAVVSLYANALSGSYVAWLGKEDAPLDADFFERNVVQLVSIPEGTTELTARCSVRIQTLEETPGEFDIAFMNLMELIGDEYQSVLDEPLFVWSNDDDTGQQWVTPPAITVDARSLAGQDLYFALASLNDETFPTDFRIDSCSLVARVCPAGPAGPP